MVTISAAGGEYCVLAEGRGAIERQTERQVDGGHLSVSQILDPTHSTTKESSPR